MSKKQPDHRKKLLVVAGAGAALEFGMPSVAEVDKILLRAASRHFSLATDPSTNLYGYLREKITTYWQTEINAPIGKIPNFEDMLFAITNLASAYPAGFSTIGSFVTTNPLPEILRFSRQELSGSGLLCSLGQHLADELIEDFRRRCSELDPKLESKMAELANFFSALTDKFKLAVVTTNYDDLIYRCIPGIVTGFDLDDGHFRQGLIIDRADWRCLLHLHGSVHFDMDLTDGDLHGIKWQDNLKAQFHQNSIGRSSYTTVEGNSFPTSSIIAGYGKTAQIQRLPFRTYYSELDRLVYQSDAVLFLGFSLIDAHVRQAFENYRDGRDRPVVFIDFAPDNALLAGNDFHTSDTGPARAIRVFRVGPNQMTWLGYTHPEAAKTLKDAREFERCTDQGRRLSIWYSGMLEACRHTDKIMRECWPH